MTANNPGGSRLDGKRILVTSADTYMGPPIVELFTAEGAEVIADNDPLIDPAAPARLVDAAGNLDAL
ncbi:MAG: short-chain dehydrogenase, partial [Acidimicrobiales bacterium]